ncbi:MAG: FKBP-type peptidyl-prolyl cis-trans isomerase [Rickettsiaceae bacterium]|nr:FKBP-type peptidyl-prolyl cis-trans isomerase [Rickettsiaceae bacterium]
MQKLVTLIVVAGILYMLYQHNVNMYAPKGNQPPPANSQNEKINAVENNSNDDVEVSGNFLERTLSKMLINALKTEEGRLFFENILQPIGRPIAGSDHGFKLNNDHLINSIFKIKTFGKGEIGPASCGHLVKIKYQLLTLKNVPFEEKTVNIALGSKDTIPGMSAVVTGMKVGQTRHALIPGSYINKELETNNNSSFKINVILQEILPQNFIDNNVKIFDDEIVYKWPLVCGNKVAYDVKITKLSSGEVIYDSTKLKQKILMRIGDVTFPLIFSHALHNKIPVGTRSVIAKGKYFKSYANEFSQIFPKKTLPKDEYFMIEFFNIMKK